MKHASQHRQGRRHHRSTPHHCGHSSMPCSNTTTVDAAIACLIPVSIKPSPWSLKHCHCRHHQSMPRCRGQSSMSCSTATAVDVVIACLVVVSIEPSPWPSKHRSGRPHRSRLGASTAAVAPASCVVATPAVDTASASSAVAAVPQSRRPWNFSFKGPCSGASTPENIL